MVSPIWEGVAIGGAGGAVAGIVVYLVQYVHTRIAMCIDERRVYNWLKSNTSNERGGQFRSTRAIASWNNLTEDRVRAICSDSKRVFLSTGDKEDLWGIHEREHKPQDEFLKGKV